MAAKGLLSVFAVTRVDPDANDYVVLPKHYSPT